MLTGTEGADQLFFSPDSQWIGFFADSKLKKVAVLGGAPITLCASGANPRGASWGEDGNIIANLDNLRLARVPEVGGEPVDLPKPGERKLRTYRWPQVLPGARAVLFISSASAGVYEDANIEAMDLKTGKVKTVHHGGYFARYLSSGHLLYVHQNTLFAAAMDPDTLQLRGAPQPIFEEVAGAGQGAARLTFSSTGTLIYLTGNSAGDERGSFDWMDSSGKLTAIFSAEMILTPQLSPDGKRLAYHSANDIWVYDLERNLPTRLTLNGQTNRFPVWTPDGKHLIYEDDMAHKIWWFAADGTGEPVELLADPNIGSVTSLSPDGGILAYTRAVSRGDSDIWTLPIDASDPLHPKPGKPHLLIGGPSLQSEAVISPDGRWIAYASRESGIFQVFVRPFPDNGSGGRWQISPNGGEFPRWSSDSHELLYLAPDDRIMAVPYVAKGAAFSREKERVWSPTPVFRTGRFRSFDVAPDGKRVVMIPKETGEQSTRSGVHVNVLLNFGDELKRRVR